MKTQQPGGSTLVSQVAAAETGPAPGKQTLVGGIEAAQPAAPPLAGGPGDASGAGLASGAELTGGPGLDGGTQLEAGAFFSGPDAGMSAEVPSIAPPDKISDAAYEAASGVKAAIDKKTMKPVAGVNGQSFTATGCAGKPEGKVTFTFDRAFIGDYDYAPAGRVVRGVHVIISAALSGCGEHKEVKLIQILRNITKQGGKMVTADPQYATRRERSGWSDPNAKSRGWRVDGLDSDTSPFYVSSDFYGSHGSDKEAAKLRDTPGGWDTDRNVGKEFRTCAVSYAGGKGTVLACVDWGYYVDDAGAATFYPAKPTAYAGAVTELKDAAERWDNMAGNDKANLQ